MINYTVEEFLNSSVIGRFQQTLTLVYQQGGAAVTKVINPIERGILVPPPPNKHGYVLQSGVCLCVCVCVCVCV